MDILKKITSNPFFVKTAVVLAIVLVLLLLARIFAKRYNRGYSGKNLIISRVFLVGCLAVIALWIIGLI